MPLPSESKYKVLLKEGLITAYVRIKGPRTYRVIKMAIDTGATYTIIPHETAVAIGYDPTLSKRRIEIATAGGLIFVPIIRIKSLDCFGVEVKNIDVICHDLPTQSPVKGLLGLNFLIYFEPFQKFLQDLKQIFKKP